MQTVKYQKDDFELDNESRNDKTPQVQEFEKVKEEVSSKQEITSEKDNSVKNFKTENNYKTCFGLLHEGSWREMVQRVKSKQKQTDLNL